MRNRKRAVLVTAPAQPIPVIRWCNTHNDKYENCTTTSLKAMATTAGAATGLISYTAELQQWEPWRHTALRASDQHTTHRGCFSNRRLYPTKAAFLGCHVIKRRWRPSQSEGSLEDSLRFTSFIQLNLKDAWDVSSTSFNHPQSFVPIPFHENKLKKNESVLSLSEFNMKYKTQIMFSDMKG